MPTDHKAIATISALVWELNCLVDRAEEMADHFRLFMDGLVEGGSSWNAADMRVRNMNHTISGARGAMAAADLFIQKATSPQAKQEAQEE